jgi:transposase
MVRRHELSDAQWDAIKDLVPPPKEKGRKPEDPRRVLNGIFWILNTGAPWRDLPARYGIYQTVYHRFAQFRKDGTLDRILEALQMKLDELGRIDWDLFCVDGTSVRATKAAAGASTPKKTSAKRAKSRKTTRSGNRAGAGEPKSTS